MPNLQFELFEFVKNLKYMGIGMVGVFLIIGVIIAATYATNIIINKLTQKKKGE